MLIAKGVEGWNCPSLFACALIKEQTTSNNYVLQAATRCLRQTPGNRHSAKIFLDYGNARTLDKELQDNFGTDLDRLSAGERDKETVTLRIVKNGAAETGDYPHGQTSCPHQKTGWKDHLGKTATTRKLPEYCAASSPRISVGREKY